MLLFFTTPLAFWGFLALPILVGIYWLRTRHRRYPVSSLMLWLDPQESRQGGTRIDRLVTPLLFFLELLALTLLVLAAADPHFPLRESVRPLIVVLDDSFSMQAGGERSPRSQAVQALAEELKRRPRHSVRFLLAGDNTQALGETAHTTAEALDRLRDWHCRAATSRLEEALSFAVELGGELPLLLVLTDREPPTELHKGRVQWWSFGLPRANVAIVNAARTPHEGGERCLLEIANFADNTEETTLVLETGDPPVEWQRSSLRLRPRETRRVILTLPEQTSRLSAHIDDDDLAIDNRVSLLPLAAQPVRTMLRIEDAQLRQLLGKALRATRHAVPVETQPEIVFTDRAEMPENAGDAWTVRIPMERDAVSYAGPFVLDRNHPLTEGLSLQGVVWGAGKARTIPGSPVILAGNVPLLTDQERRAAGASAWKHDLCLRLRPDLSTLPDAPGWTILIWNLLHWRASEKPGLHRTNYRLGEQVSLTFPTPGEPVVVVRPDHTRQTMPVQDRRLTLRPDEVGVWSIEAGEESTAFAVNALSANESDLTGCVTGRWGDWLDETSLRLEYQSIAWILLLLVLAIATVHMLLVARSSGRQ
ncbi:MAG TPA: BatA and WFA domain-containing protein [Gemmataceae bacterium]|nr:BatA and WFA domain-containing protein [Gemmataceae bacterium]